MTHDPELVAEARSWLVKGKMDLDAAAFELTAVPPAPLPAHFARAALLSAAEVLFRSIGVPDRIAVVGSSIEGDRGRDRDGSCY